MKESNNIKKIVLLSLASACIGLTSCDDYLKEKDLPRLTPDYYGTVAGVESAATATYSFMRWGAGNERYNVLTEYGTDLFTQIGRKKRAPREKIRESRLMLLINMEAS